MYQKMCVTRCRGLLWAPAALLVGLLTACSTVQMVRELPPADLMADCPVPILEYKVNGDLAKGLVAWRNALANCNTDKESLREWASK